MLIFPKIYTFSNKKGLQTQIERLQEENANLKAGIQEKTKDIGYETLKIFRIC